LFIWLLERKFWEIREALNAKWASIFNRTVCLMLNNPLLECHGKADAANCFSAKLTSIARVELIAQITICGKIKRSSDFSKPATVNKRGTEHFISRRPQPPLQLPHRHEFVLEKDSFVDRRKP
jgi:hypothetical protein